MIRAEVSNILETERFSFLFPHAEWLGLEVAKGILFLGENIIFDIFLPFLFF